MRHSNTELLIDYWRARKVRGQSPLRSSIDPAEIADILPQIFILGRTSPGHYVFRLAGGLLRDLHARDLRRLDFNDLWSPADRSSLGQALEASRRTAEPLLITASARTEEGLAARLQLTLAPLRAGVLPPDRMLGLYQPLSPLAQLRDQPVRDLRLISFDADGDAPALPRLRLAALDGRRIA
jgi:hypothetical protein